MKIIINKEADAYSRGAGVWAGLHLRGPAAAAAAELPDNTWIRVEGTIASPGDAPSPAIPTMTVSTLTPVDAPANSYAY